MRICRRTGVNAAALLLGLVGSAAFGETFWSAKGGALVAFELDVHTGIAQFTMQSAGGNLEPVYYVGVAREPVTGTLWVIYIDNALGQRPAIGRLVPGALRPQQVALLPENLSFSEPHPKFSPNGVLYVQAYEYSTLRFLLATVDLVTGNVNTVIAFDWPNGLRGLAFNPVNGLLYFSGWEGGHDGYIDTLTTPQHVRQRILAGDFQPGELLFNSSGEMLLMNFFFYRIENGTLVMVSFPPPVQTPFGVTYETYFTLYEGSPAENTAGCVPTLTRACLQFRRFAVEATYDATAYGGSTGTAAPRFESDESIKFTFFTPENLELFVKVIDGCGYNGHYWIFASGLTNLGVSLRVTDTSSGTVYAYDNPSGQTFAPLLDIEAFACEP